MAIDEVDARVMHMLHPLEIEVGELGSTVRLGLKWLGATDLVLCVCTDRCEGGLCATSTDILKKDVCDNCSRQGLGVVLNDWVGKFRDIPARLIEHEHEQRSRGYSGLRDSMTKAYGDLFTEDSYVTVVTYRLTHKREA